MIKKSIIELIGHTPLLELVKYQENRKIHSHIICKMEGFNPTGSIKDRIALNMLLRAKEEGLLLDGGYIIEPTSGNTGVSLASIGTYLGYRVILCMPDNMSLERIKLIKAYGAEIVLTPGKDGMDGAIKKAQELAKTLKNSFIPLQFDNPNNPEAHYKTTAKEIFDEIGNGIDCLVAGIGTGGTICGIGKFLKEKNKEIRIVGVEPLDSPFLTKGIKGNHQIQGIGAGFIPKTLDLDTIDEIIPVSYEDSKIACKALAKEEGLLVGVSAGASVHAATIIAKNNPDKTILVIIPDNGDRYLSLGIYE